MRRAVKDGGEARQTRAGGHSRGVGGAVCRPIRQPGIVDFVGCGMHPHKRSKPVYLHVLPGERMAAESRSPSMSDGVDRGFGPEGRPPESDDLIV